MAYDSRSAKAFRVAAGTAFTLSATGIAANNTVFLEPSRVTRFAAYITTAVSSSATVSVQCLYRPIYNLASAQQQIGVLKISGVALVDSVWYVDVTPFNVDAGSQVVFYCNTAATSSGAAIFELVDDYDPEMPANSPKFRQSLSA